MNTSTPTQVTIRRATPADLPEIARLATIDSAPVPGGALLLAEVDGRLRAALAIEGGCVIADPFAPSRALVALLREQRRAPAGQRGSNRWRAWASSSRRGLRVPDR